MLTFLTRAPEGPYGYRVRCPCLRAIGCALLIAAGAGCNGDDDGGGAACLDPLPLDCDVAFEPTYGAIFDNIFSTRCGVTGAGGSCHGPEGMQGGLVLADEDEAYDYLLGEIDDKARVVPGDPECSVLVQRMESDDEDFRMPLGSRKLSDTQLCAVRQWISNGAMRDGTD